MEIQFGDVEEAKPLVQLRPDRNKHYAVAAVCAPTGHDLAVFVDLDVMRDMEDHALSDTRVELGGVMLGGQFEDDQGNPFVLITDSLRAQHYEATKGSFKFTHDTWEQISREREQFPDDLRMVGWYHTHPDWGVFLSGMDMFICDHFFNKQLDVALVIDPCRGDRGFFQWTGDSEERVRRTDGFYLMASRFRQHEVNEFATYLEEQFAMSGDPRFRGGHSGPVVHVDGTQAHWQTVAVLGMLALQFCFLMLIAWRLMLDPVSPPATAPPRELAAIEASLERLSQVQREQADIEAQKRILDGIVSQWPDAPDRLVTSLSEQESQIDELRGNVRAQQALEQQLNRRLKNSELSLSMAKSRAQMLEKQVESLKDKVDQLEPAKVAAAGNSDGSAPRQTTGTAGSLYGFLRELPWGWIAASLAVGALAAGGIFASVLQQKNNQVDGSPSEETSQPTNSELPPDDIYPDRSE